MVCRQSLGEFDVVVIDEFHERRWDTDLLLAMLKTHSKHRLVLTSATMNSHALAKYVSGDVMAASGRQFEVVISHVESEARTLPNAKNLEQRVSRAIRQELDSGDGDILVFLPGRKEIAQCQSMLSGIEDLLVAPLHASVSDEERDVAIHRQPQRKVVLATNVAETSLTIDNITCVIDSGLERRTVQRNGRTTLVLTHISKASAKQRAGRAGRIRDGRCIRLYGKDAALESVTPPELQRESLIEPMVAAAQSNFCIETLELLEPLPEKSLAIAKDTLLKMSVIDEAGHVTDHGRSLSPLPLEAFYADLVSRMETKALKEAMVDLTAGLSVYSSLYSLSSNPDRHEALNKEEPRCCDAAVVIRLVRGEQLSGVFVDESVLKEAQGISAQMRECLQLPQLEVASRYDHTELVKQVAKWSPQSVFVRRARRREVLANGQMEAVLGRQTRFAESAEAALF